jgi:hypothetical protein
LCPAFGHSSPPVLMFMIPDKMVTNMQLLLSALSS